jgi:hypothetical protein
MRAEGNSGAIIRNLRAWLKIGLRTFGLRCTSIEQLSQEANMADMKKYGAGIVKPDDVRDGPRTEKIVNVYVSEKFDRPVLVLESGDEFMVNQTNARVLCRAYGFNSDDWVGHTVELSIGTYVDRQDGETKDTVMLKAISSRDDSGANGSQPSKPPAPPTSTLLPAKRDDMSDEIPF